MCARGRHSVPRGPIREVGPCSTQTETAHREQLVQGRCPWAGQDERPRGCTVGNSHLGRGQHAQRDDVRQGAAGALPVKGMAVRKQRWVYSRETTAHFQSRSLLTGRLVLPHAPRRHLSGSPCSAGRCLLSPAVLFLNGPSCFLPTKVA